MADRATTLAGVELPADVMAFAVEHKVDPYLPPLVEMTRRVFPSAGHLNVQLEEDPEIAADRRIVFDVAVTLPVTAAVEATHRWYRELFQCCPSTEVWVFRLGLQLVS